MCTPRRVSAANRAQGEEESSQPQAPYCSPFVQMAMTSNATLSSNTRPAVSTSNAVTSSRAGHGVHPQVQGLTDFAPDASSHPRELSSRLRGLTYTQADTTAGPYHNEDRQPSLLQAKAAQSTVWGSTCMRRPLITTTNTRNTSEDNQNRLHQTRSPTPGARNRRPCSPYVTTILVCRMALAVQIPSKPLAQLLQALNKKHYGNRAMGEEALEHLQASILPSILGADQGAIKAYVAALEAVGPISNLPRSGQGLDLTLPSPAGVAAGGEGAVGLPNARLSAPRGWHGAREPRAVRELLEA